MEHQFSSPNSRSRVKLKPGKTFKIAVTYEIVQLDSRTGVCQDYEGQNTFDSCMDKGLQDVMMREVGCTVPFISNRSQVCGAGSEEKRLQAFAAYQNNRRNQDMLCANPCGFMNIYFGPPVEEEDNQTRIIMYFRRDVKVTSEYYLISLVSMIAEIGGYASLLLGFSLFNLPGAAEFVIEKASKLCSRKKRAACRFKY